jgi:hypothetical protein
MQTSQDKNDGVALTNFNRELLCVVTQGNNTYTAVTQFGYNTGLRIVTTFKKMQTQYIP